MPNLNVKGESSPGKASSGGGGGLPKIVIYILAAVVGLGLIAFILNTTGVVKLWGKKKPQPVVVDLPPEDNYVPPTFDTTQQDISDTMAQTENTNPNQPMENSTIVQPKGKDKLMPKGAEKKTASHVVMGTGMYSVQISSFTSEEKANVQARAFSDAGYPAFVEQMGGWYRVCIGRFESRSLAKEQGDKLVHMLENNYAIVKVNQ